MDYIQSLDPRSLVSLETGLSFIISPFHAPVYNFPLFLFGVHAQDSPEVNQSLKLFTGLLGLSALLDIVWMARNDMHWFIKIILLIILVLKAPTFLSFFAAIRQTGDPFSVRGGDLRGATVWSMPGAFPSLSAQRGGYQDVDAGRDVEANPRTAPHSTQAPPAQPQAPSQPPGGYQASPAPPPASSQS